jgi:two-component system OmpR family response regulator
MPETARVLVVDPEPRTAHAVAASLGVAGFAVATAPDLAQAVRDCAHERPHVVLLDVRHADSPGLAELNRHRHLQVLGLAKPICFPQLVASVREAALRSGAAVTADAQPRLRVGELVLDEATRECWLEGRPVDLSPTEFDLLRYLMRNAGTVVSKADILRHVWRYDFGGDAGVVESYISYLRRKLDAGGGPPLIRTRRGVGYALRSGTPQQA